MIHRRHGAMRFEQLLWITKAPPRRVGLYLINTTLPRKSGIDACISSRITTGIQVVRDYQRNYNWYNEPFAVFKVKELYLDMHGLIFETSVWLLAESTRLLSRTQWLQGHCGAPVEETSMLPLSHAGQLIACQSSKCCPLQRALCHSVTIFGGTVRCPLGSFPQSGRVEQHRQILPCFCRSSLCPCSAQIIQS